MEQFNYIKFVNDNPLLKETSGYGNYTKPETMLEKDSSTDPLGPDEELMEEINIEDETMEHLEQFRQALAMIAAAAQKSEDRQWIAAIRNIYNKLVDLEDSIYDASQKLGVIPDGGLEETKNLSEGTGKVDEVFNIMIEHMRSLIKKTGLDDDDVHDLRVKLANFFK